MRISAAGIVVVACAITAPQALATVGFGAAFGWVPAAGLVEALRRRSSERGGAVVAAAIDLAALALLVVALPQLSPFLTWLPFLLVALYSQVDLRLGAAVAVTSVATATVAQAQVPLPGDPVIVVGLYAAALAATVWLQRGWRATQVETSSALTLAHGRAQAVFANIADAVVVTGAGGRVRQLNPAAERTLGCPGGAAVGVRCHEIFELRRDGRPLDCSAGCALLAHGDAADTGVEVTRRLPTGAVQPLLATAKVLRDSDGHAIEVVHSFQDISELKRAQEAQTLFLATATHELKTPLTLILGFSEMLRTRTDLEEGPRQVAVDTIHRRALELDRIVEQLLLTSRIGAGRSEVETTVGDVTAAVRDAVAALAEVTDHTLRFHAPPDLPEVRHDARALSTILDHLLDNALKYSPEGGEVVVELRALDHAVELTVRDRGIGMTAEQQAHCFERFWQAEHDSVRRFAGTGLGLYIVRSLVTATGAELSVDSAPGVGSSFHVRLPRADREPTEPVEPSAVPEAGERTMVDEFMRQAGLRGAPS